MINGIGVDLVAINRFDSWKSFSPERLNKVFSDQELIDARDKNGNLISAKLASRFAAKEAFYKALSSVCVAHPEFKQSFSLLQILSAVEMRYDARGVPFLRVDWFRVIAVVDFKMPPLQVHLSLSHEQSQAIAFVVIERVS